MSDNPHYVNYGEKRPDVRLRRAASEAFAILEAAAPAFSIHSTRGEPRRRGLPRLFMLPDYPQFKDLFKRFFDRELKQRTEARLGPLFREMGKRRHFEGDRSQMLRPDEEQPDETEYSISQGSFSFHVAEIPTLTTKELVRRIDVVAEEMARSVGKGVFASMDRTLEKYDRVMKLGPPSPEVLLAMISNSEVSFDEDGPTFQIVVPPSLLEAAQDAASRLMDDPELYKQYTELMALKWEEWRARETDRGLDG